MDQINPSQLLEKLNTPEGKRLLAMMQKDGGAAFSKAAAAAKSGNYAKAQSILSPLIEGTEAEKLASAIAEKIGK